MDKGKSVLLVGDNPFHGISHLSQEKARVRGDELSVFEYAADLVLASVENGANGFMFSVSETTLSILSEVQGRGRIEDLRLYAIVPYAYEYVRLTNKVGGLRGLARKFSKEMVMSGNWSSVATGLKGVLRADPISLMKAYLDYEVSRVKSAAGKQGNLSSVLLHEIVTDLALALDLDWLFRSYVDLMVERGLTPGFNTGNFAYMVEKFGEWGIDLQGTVIAAPFNKIGFQMNPSREHCEKALADLPEPALLAISIFAAGYLRPPEAIGYVATLPNVRGVAVGISKEKHARETFRLLKEKLD